MTPTPKRQQIKRYLTPDIRDYLVVETADTRREGQQLPAKGSSHPDAAKYPNHVFVHAAPSGEDKNQGLIYDVFYLAPREDQDLYNWEFTDADIGGTKFEAVRRTYVTLRKDFTPASPIMGAAMANIPASKFTAATTYVLADRQQQRTGDEVIDGAFVMETRTYVKKVTLRRVMNDLRSGRSKYAATTLYYRGETISGTAIESLAADLSNAYWGTQTSGVFRELEQISYNWFAVTESTVVPDGATNSVSNPARARVQNRVTPLGTDILFTEVGTLPSPVPTYGDAHYDTVNWPNHKLSLIEPADETGLLYRLTYVADRASQDTYNWEHTHADLGGTKFNAVKRTYVTPRSTFAASASNYIDEKAPLIGAAMPNTPTGYFNGTYVLASKGYVRIGDPALDSLYVAEERTYVEKVAMTQNDYDEALSGNLQSTQTLYYRGEDVSGSGTAQVETLTVVGTVTVAVAASKTLSIALQPANDETISINGTTFTFKTTPTDPAVDTEIEIGVDVAATRLNVRSVINAKAVGGTLAAFVSADAVFTWGTAGTVGNAIVIAETMAGAGNEWAGGAVLLSGGVASGSGTINITVTSAVVTGSPLTLSVTVAAGDTAAVVAQKIAVVLDASAAVYSKFLTTVSGASVSLTRRAQEANDGTLNIALALNTATGLTAVTTSTNTTAGAVGSSTVEALFADEDSTFWGLQGNFTSREGTQLTDNWFVVTVRQVVPSYFSTTGRSYQTSMNYSWPAVFSDLTVDSWSRVAGGSDQYVKPYYAKEAYSGPCKATISEKFYVAPPVAQEPNVMLPLPMQLQTPFFGFSVGPSLHELFTVTISTGSDHPVYELTNGSWTFPATSPTDWPESIVASDEIRPFRGGYLKTTITVFPPTYTA